MRGEGGGGGRKGVGRRGVCACVGGVSGGGWGWGWAIFFIECVANSTQVSKRGSLRERQLTHTCTHAHASSFTFTFKMLYFFACSSLVLNNEGGVLSKGAGKKGRGAGCLFFFLPLSVLFVFFLSPASNDSSDDTGDAAVAGTETDATTNASRYQKKKKKTDMKCSIKMSTQEEEKKLSES